MRARIRCLSLLFLFAASTGAADSRPSSERPQIAVQAENLVLFSAGSNLGLKVGAGTDTFCLYGGPGSLEGKFQQIDGVIPDAQGWTHRDVTDQQPKWQLSTFNSPNGTQAYWAGQTAAQQPGWSDAPGYGNGWNELLQYARSVSNPAAGQVVGLEFTFNHDTEPGYDYFIVEYDSANVTIPVLRLDGSNKDSSSNFVPVHFPADVTVLHAIEYQGNDYAGDLANEIVIRIRATSDGAWSDEDGLFPTDGLAQVDDISVASSEGTDLDDFNAGPGNWVPAKAPFAGDFSKVFARSSDLDPCLEDITPLIGFIDDGTPASNPGGVLPNGDPILSIGTTSINWNYGIPGGWVVNYNGGVSFGSIALDNEWWSPEIDWDLPGTADDDVAIAGAQLRFSVYRHLPLINGIFYQWGVRGRSTGTGSWSAWDDYSFVYYSSATDWFNQTSVVAPLIPSDRDQVQIQLAVRDFAYLFAFPGSDATPSPLFDNVAMLKYRIQGPSIVTRTIDIFGDAFSQTGLADVSTQGARDLLDCRVDMNRDVSSGGANTPGDSMVVDVESLLPGVAISDPATQITLHYNLSMNPVFESAIRANAPVTSPGTGRQGWNVSEGTVASQQSTTSAGNPVQNRRYFDLPDADFLYPGDVLEYYVEAVDDDGNRSTLPADLSGFGDGSGNYSRVWTVHALPTYFDATGDQPSILVWNDFGHRGGENETHLAFWQLGYEEGLDYDVYTTKGPSSGVGNGLGSAGAHGATAAQLAGYDCIIYEAGDLGSDLISDGSDSGPNDESNDIGVLTTWFNQNADRSIAHFGDNVASYLAQGSSAQVTYLSTIMNVSVNDADVRDEIGGQTAPLVQSTGALPSYFSGEFVAFGGCPVINRFDSIEAGPGAVSAYGFRIPAGGFYGGVSAAVAWATVQGGYDKRSLTFPYAFHEIQGSQLPNSTTRQNVLDSVLNYFGHVVYCVTAPCPPDSPPGSTFELHRSVPNPFNPVTTLSFTLGAQAEGSVRIYNLRGELVRTLAVGSFDAGRNEVMWDGADGSGDAVASGVYVAKFDVGGFRANQKLALVK